MDFVINVSKKIDAKMGDFTVKLEHMKGEPGRMEGLVPDVPSCCEHLSNQI